MNFRIFNLGISSDLFIFLLLYFIYISRLFITNYCRIVFFISFCLARPPCFYPMKWRNCQIWTMEPWADPILLLWMSELSTSILTYKNVSDNRLLINSTNPTFKMICLYCDICHNDGNNKLFENQIKLVKKALISFDSQSKLLQCTYCNVNLTLQIFFYFSYNFALLTFDCKNSLH